MGLCASSEDVSPPPPKAQPKGQKPAAGKKGAMPKNTSVLNRESENLNDFYSLGKELGRGQFGITYECTSKATGEKLACKAISKQKLKTQAEIEDVRREVAIMYHLGGNDAIVNLKGAYEDSRNVYLVMEVCSGGELFNRIVELGHYSERKAADMFRTALKVVVHCQRMGVIHRDLKPENFLLTDKTDKGQLKATDFGLSVFFKKGQTFDEMVGSAYYVAPEVLKRSYGPECDTWSAGVILYILLSGMPPFWGDNEKAIFDSILVGHVDFSEAPWPSISAGAKDLVSKLLQKDIKKRITAEDALAHPWLGGNAPDNAIDSEVLVRMRNFSSLQKFKKLGLMLLVRHLKKEEIEGLRQLFLDMDADNSGQITLDELRRGLDRHGAHIAKSEVEALMSTMDVQGDGQIDYDEFLAATVHLSKLESEENLLAAFDDLDTDKSGFITSDELEAQLLKLGMKADPAEVKTIIAEADTNKDGKIDYSEFVNVMAPKLLGHMHSDEVSMKRQMKMKGLR